MFWHYLKKAVYRPVPDSRLSWTLTNKILQVLLKALLVLQEAHGYIIIRFTFIQLCEEDPTRQTACEKQCIERLPVSLSGKNRHKLTCYGRI